jgi:DNA-binding NtrC family response regulator
MKILLIEDSVSQRDILKGFLQKNGFEVIVAENGEIGITKYKENEIDLVISDYRMPVKNGLEVLREIKQIYPPAAIMIITAYSDVKDAVQIIKEGAVDYILKPIDLEELLSKIRQIKKQIEIIQDNEEIAYKISTRDISQKFIGESSKIKEILSMVRRIAVNPVTVLITGESGTGKELIADLIHDLSSRRNNKLVKVNCAALSSNLLESELFGHVKGAFTGAIKDRKGRFEEADGGTIFLDEIGEISPELQVKLLRVLQNMTFEPVGSSNTVQVDVRIITATNKKLQDEMLKGNFREDLYYRLNVVPISMPPLRERKEDIPLLIEHFLRELELEDKISFSPPALHKMITYEWDGNIRQLKNIITRIVTLTRNSVISVDDLPAELSTGNSVSLKSDPIKLETVEKEHIGNILKLCGGNRKKAAEMLGIHRNTLTKKIKDFHL